MVGRLLLLGALVAALALLLMPVANATPTVDSVPIALDNNKHVTDGTHGTDCAGR